MGNSRVSPLDDAAGRERDDLLATKLTIPRLRPERLARSRLIEALNAALARELITVCAPAGFGKTTLLADWATSAAYPVAWLSLDPDDNDPARFWRYVVAALGRACGGLDERLAPLLSGPGVLPGPGVVTALINVLEALPDELVLTLDDYHLVQSSAIHEDMAFLLGRLPARLHVVIASRSDPPLPLARLRASDALAELRGRELRFTPEESAAFLRDVWKLDLSAQAVAALEARTEGWVVGLQLAALSLRERRDPDAFLQAFTGSHRYVLDYLSEEVLKDQPERLRTFLLQTSILERLSGPLCDAVTGGDDGQDTLEGLERANLFLVPLDEQRRWYRLHHLFADLLRAQLQQAQAGQVPDLHRRAAGWCEQHGLVDDAIRHALASGDARWATRLVEQNLNDTLGRGEGMILERWLSALPGDAVRASPSLCFAQTLMQLRLGHLDTFERLMEHGECAIDQGQWVPEQLEVPTAGGLVAAVRAASALLRAEVAVSQGDAEGAAEHARSALAQMTETEHGPRRWARWLLACADWMGGRLADAESAFAEVLAEGRAAVRRDSRSPRASPVEAASTPLIAGCFTLGRVQRTRANLGAALRTYEEGLRFAGEAGHLSPYHAAEAHVGIAQVLYERDELDHALEHVTAGIDLSQQMVELTVPIFGLVTLAWIRQARGDPDGALAAMDDACRMRPSIEVSPHNPGPAEWARLALAQGRLDDAARWARERGLTEDADLCYPREPDYLVLARVLVAQGFPDRALHLLERLDRLAQSQGRTESLIRIRTVRALAMHAAGDRPGALAMLADALALGRPEGYARVFADEGPPLAALLRSLVSARPRAPVGTVSPQLRQQVSRVRQAFETVTAAPERPVPAAGLVEPLTGRELEVLRLIADGRHNREIARDLYVTLDTVKKHTSHILTKLSATSRTHAVARARELDLIP